MSFREKLLDFKRRLSDRKMYSITIIIIGVVAIWGFYQYKQASHLRQKLDNQYNRSFLNMLGYVDNVQTLLAKSLITSSPTMTGSLLDEARRQANFAQENLGQLPISQQALANTSKFLIQVGDYSAALNNQNLSGKALSKEQYDMLEKLQGFSVSLNKSLDELQNQIFQGRLKWGELENAGNQTFKKTSAQAPLKQFEKIEDTFQKYPTLIYDGPFSDHLENIAAKGVTGDKLTIEQAKLKVKSFIGADKISSIENTGKNNTGWLKSYSFKVVLKNSPKDHYVSIDTTQTGGHVLWMLNYREVEKESLNMQKAKDIAKKFLMDKGFVNMVDTYYLKEDGVATINYAYTQNNITVYPDLIKVKIALDNGEIVGFEAKGYLNSHTQRNIPKPNITLEEAKAKLNKNLQISSSGLAIIPTNYATEIFAYEFKGKLNDNDFIIYINALTGEEEDILLIVNTPEGILTM